MEEEQKCPEEISCEEQVFDLAFHPTQSVIAAALVTGAIELWRFGISAHSNRQMISLNHHQGACRGVSFDPTGQKLYTASSDKSWNLLNEYGQLVSSKKGAHKAPINKISSFDENQFISGDDNGVVKLWDSRCKGAEAMSWDAHQDFITDFEYVADNSTVLSSGGDATLCVYDIRKQQNFYRSDDQESELSCVRVVKNSQKAICGTQDGVLLFFKWGDWGDCCDRYPGHPESITSMIKYDESSVITGSSDGIIRLISILPNKILGVLGDHDEFPVEGLRMSSDKQLLASIAHDEDIRFWDLSILADDDDADKEGEGQMENEKEDGEVDAEIVDGEMDDDSDDVDEEAEDLADMDSDEEDSQFDEDEDSDDSSEKDVNPAKSSIRIKSATEKFYSDL